MISITDGRSGRCLQYCPYNIVFALTLRISGAYLIAFLSKSAIF